MNNEYKIYDLRLEYGNFSGDIHTAVISDLPLSQLLSKNPELRNKKFELFNEQQWLDIKRVFDDSWKNNMKHHMRDIRHGDVEGYRDGETELFMKAMDLSPVEDEALKNIEIENLHNLILNSGFTTTQLRRLKLHYFCGKSQREIALLEGVSHKQVGKSIELSKNKLRKFLK